MKTKDEITAEIKKLRDMKPNVRHFTSFGDDNWACIEAQIRTLQTPLDEDAIWDHWSNDETDVYERDGARDALEWRNSETFEGKDASAPSEDWESLLTATAPVSKPKIKPRSIRPAAKKRTKRAR